MVDLVFRTRSGESETHCVSLRVPQVAASQEYLVDGRLYNSCYMAGLLLGRIALDGEGFTGQTAAGVERGSDWRETGF